MSSSKKINNEILIEDMWEGLGGNFDNIQQIIFEFVDNSISNLTGRNSNELQNKQINIRFDVKSDEKIVVSIEDSGTGIIDLDNALKIGNKSVQESPLNEHGFGLKHALAAADKANENWKIYTRTAEDLFNNQYELIEAPYKTGDWEAKIVDAISWPGTLNTTGTIVQFNIDKILLSTLTEGIKGSNINTSYQKMIEYFIEDVSFTYATIVEKNLVKINVKLLEKEALTRDENITPLKPNWKHIDKSGTVEVKLGNGPVVIDYKFGSIEASENKRYYKRNMLSSGAEIRINGRVLEHNMLYEIWGKKPHNSVNHFLAIIDVKSNDKKLLPETKTAKNAFKKGEEKYEKLIGWIHSTYPKIEEINESNDDYNEVKMFRDLASNLKRFGHQEDTITTEQYVFEEDDMKLRIDLYQKVGSEIKIYEGKKHSTTPKDAYQLRMYWDGLVLERITPTVGYVLGETHPESVKKMIDYLNQMKDANGNNYNFELKNWEEYNISTDD